MNMNILSWVALALLIIFALNGRRRGLIMTVFSTFTMVISIAVAINVSPYVSQTWQDTTFFNIISEHVEETLFGEDAGELHDVSEQAEAIQSLPLPDSIKDALLENNNTQIYDALGITAFKSYVANYLTCLMINALSFMLVFLGSVIVLKIVAGCLNIISYLPVLHSMNKLGGFLLGLVNGFVVLWIVCIAATIFSGTGLGGYIYGQINNSMFLRFIYDHNYLLTIIASLAYLLI